MVKSWKMKMALILCVFAMATGITAVSAFASAKVRKVEYEGNGKVDVDFKGYVQYKNVKVIVKDTSGKKYTAKVTDKDRDDLNFKVTGVKSGKKYTFTIKGIRKKGETKYGSVKGSFRIPKKSHGITIKEIEYDARDRDVNFDFAQIVQWKNPTVSIKAGGTEYAAGIEEKDRDDIEVNVKKLTAGKKYSYTITGIRKKGTTEYVTLKGTFIA